MKNDIVRLKAWKQLESKGFQLVKYTSNGVTVRGCSLNLDETILRKGIFNISKEIMIEPRYTHTNKLYWYIKSPIGLYYDIKGRNLVKAVDKILLDLKVLKSYEK